MTGFLARAARFFVAPAEPAGLAPPRAGARRELASPRAAFAPPRPHPEVAGLTTSELFAATGPPPTAHLAIGVVLSAEVDLLVAGGVVAASLRRQAGAPAALVCAWRGHAEPPLLSPVPGAPGAWRLAAKLTRRGMDARACGAVCAVELPAEPEAAVAAFRGAVTAAGAPVVLALARRDPAFDPVLAGADRLVLAVDDDADRALAELALQGLWALGPAAERIDLPRGVIARQAARLGLAASRPASPNPPALQEGLS